MLLRELEPEKYWSFPSSYSKEKRESEIRNMILDGKHSFQLKTDGNYSAFICDFDGEKRLISRGISKVTSEYGRLEDQVFFFDSIAKAFDKPTRIMGEIYLEHGVDKNVGSILRASSNKAKSIQDNNYYEEARARVKFSAKDKRDIENNEFRGEKLKWRIFDVWYYDGEDLTNTPWIMRQEYVKAAAKRINNPLVTSVPYYAMDENFYDYLAEIFQKGGEGVVIYRNDGKVEPGKRTAHKTLKVKQELEHLIDAFVVGTEPAIKAYTGKDLANWELWENSRTGEKLYGKYFGEYQIGGSVTPVSKGYWNNWPGAIYVAVYDQNGNEFNLCKVAGLTEEFKTELRDNFAKYDHCPVTIGGMALSDSNGLSIRHPYLKAVRLNDLNIKTDCTLTKILS